MDSSRRRVKYDRYWLRNTVSDEASGIVRQYEACFGRTENLETIIRNYPYSPIPAGSRSEFLKNSTAILFDNLEDMNNMLGTTYVLSEEQIRKSTNVGYLESTIHRILHGRRILDHFRYETGTHMYIRTGKISYFGSRAELFVPKRERVDAPVHEWCHKILKEANYALWNCDEPNEGIAVCVIGILHGKYGGKADLDVSIARFNCLDFTKWIERMTRT